MIGRIAIVVALATTLTLGVAQTSSATESGRTPRSGPVRSSGCGSRLPVTTATTSHRITSGGIDRVYDTQLPAGYDGTQALPIVLALHPLSIPYTVAPSIAGLGDAAQDHDFITVVPSGRINGATPFWNATPVHHNDDVAFIADVLDDVESQLCVDESRVFSTGMSNGGQMSSILACRLPHRITAVAPIAGVEFYDQCKGKPVPVVAFHGDADPIVTYEGGGLNATEIARQNYWKGTVPPGVPKHDGVDGAMRRWAKHNGCDRKAKETRISDEVVKRTWAGCEASTTLYIVEGGGHSWPGRPVPGYEQTFGHTTTDIDATQLSFDLFFGPASRRTT